MPRISITAPKPSKNPNAPPPPRKPLLQVLGQDAGASPRGSTYFGMLRSCPREFALSQVAGLRLVQEQEHFTLGKLYHYAREVYYDAIFDHQAKLEYPTTRVQKDHFFWGNIRQAQEEAWAVVAPIEKEDGYHDTWHWLQKTFGAYCEAYWKTDEWEIVGSEEPIDIRIDGVRYTTRLDLVVFDWNRNGYWVDEAKTARFLTDDLISNYQQDFQVLGEVDGFERKFGYDKPLLGVNISIVTKQENPKVTRVEVNPSRAHIREFEKSLVAFSSLRAVYKELGWPKALGNCAGAKRGYSKCQFYSVCHDFPHMEVEDFMEAGIDPPDGYEFSGTKNQDTD